MFVKSVLDSSSHIRLYKLYSKHTTQHAANIIINLYHVPKIGLDKNTIFFHLPSHTQTIEYVDPIDAETEFHHIYAALKK